MLRNPIYVGRVEVPKWGVNRSGDFEPLVGESVFRRVESRLAGKPTSPLLILGIAQISRFVGSYVAVSAVGPSPGAGRRVEARATAATTVLSTPGCGDAGMTSKASS